MKKYLVKLTETERSNLTKMTTTGKIGAQQFKRAMILLKADQSDDGPGWKDEKIHDAFEVGTATVQRVRRKFVEEGLDAALERRPYDTSRTSRRKRNIDGDFEAKLVALCCSDPPEGHARWSLRLLADRVVELEYIEEVSHETVRKILKKNELKPWRKLQWCIPPDQNGEFVCAMEDILEVYKRPYNPAFPVVCMDETSKQLLKETRVPLTTRPGHPARYDYEYERNGTCNIFLFVEPLAGWRRVEATARRTRVDWALQIQKLLDVDYPDAEKVILVMDNLNTHAGGSLYEAFDPAEARRLLERLEIHYTPKHGSWLNISEIELRALSSQCLDRRIADFPTVQVELGAWEARRNAKTATVNWQFTTEDARVKLRRCGDCIHQYPIDMTLVP